MVGWLTLLVSRSLNNISKIALGWLRILLTKKIHLWNAALQLATTAKLTFQISFLFEGDGCETVAQFACKTSEYIGLVSPA